MPYIQMPKTDPEEQKTSLQEQWDAEDDYVNNCGDAKCGRCGSVSFLRPKCQCDPSVAVFDMSKGPFKEECTICKGSPCSNCSYI
jgi:hypothetical protein